MPTAQGQIKMTEQTRNLIVICLFNYNNLISRIESIKNNDSGSKTSQSTILPLEVEALRQSTHQLALEALFLLMI